MRHIKYLWLNLLSKTIALRLYNSSTYIKLQILLVGEIPNINYIVQYRDTRQRYVNIYLKVFYFL